MKELLYLKDDQLKDLIEKLFIGYRETFSDSKKILDKYSIGLAHQKVIHLLSMYEGISISELLKKLKVTKQSLNRVLKDLIKLEIITFTKDDKDTRIKHLHLNKKGKEVDAGVAETEMPADIHNLNKIEKIYLSQLAEDLCAFIPEPVLEKNTVKKESEDSKRAKSQRKVIHGLISE